MKITKLDKTGFTTEDGTYYEHPIPLDEVLSLEEFQKIYERIEKIIIEEIENNG